MLKRIALLSLPFALTSTLAAAMPAISGKYDCKDSVSGQGGVLEFAPTASGLKMSGLEVGTEGDELVCDNQDNTVSSGDVTITTKTVCNDTTISLYALLQLTAKNTLIETAISIVKTSATALTVDAKMKTVDQNQPANETAVTLNCTKL